MIKLLKNRMISLGLERKRTRRIFTLSVSLVITGILLTVYYLLPVMGAPVDVLNGNGGMDDSTQIGAWTLTNITGANSWSFDNSTSYAGTGSGLLQSPTGNNISYNGYVYYRFTTTKVPVSASLSLAYRKNYYNGQPAAGNWSVQAEIWQVGGTAPLEVIPIDPGTSNTSWTNLSNQSVTAVTGMNTQYELRLVQKGTTGSDPAAFERTWFDSIQLNVNYDTTPPQVVSASAATDHSVDVVFNEAVDQATAETVSNYSITSGLSVTGAALQPDGKTVRLTTTAQTNGAAYTVSVNNVKDISGNAMTTPGTATFNGVDTTPPTVVSAISVTDSSVDVQFSEPVDPNTAQNAANYSISPSLAVTAAVLQADGRTVRLTTARQTLQASYTVTAGNIADLSGNIIAGNNSASFTGTDTTPPTVVSATTVNDTTVDVLFSEAVDGTSAQSAANYSISPSLAVTAAVLQADGKTVRLTTDKQTYQINYTVTVNGVKDLAGNVINGNNTEVFGGADTTPPSVNSATGQSNDSVNVVFSEPVDTASAQDISNYAISPSLSVSSAVLQSDGVTVKLSTSAQTGGANYTVTVTGVKDLAGNIVNASGNTSSFVGTSPPSGNPPQVVSAAAINSSTVDVTFNATMDPATAQNVADYSISPTLGITGAILKGDGVTVELSTAAQTAGNVYTVTVTNIQDIYGNIIGNSNNTATFTGNGRTAQNPHGNYMVNTNQCANCHVTHNAQGPDLLNQPTETQTCYLCHDAGGQSKYDVADQFGKTAPYAASHHNVPEGTMQCSDCHNPHDDSASIQGDNVHWPRLLQSAADQAANGGNRFCLSCHKTAQGSIPAINPDTYPAAGVGHNNANFTINGTTPFNPASGTGISCEACHQPHGSSLGSLLKTDPNSDGTTITADDKSQCYECHSGASADKRYLGKDVYDNTTDNPHALTSSTNTNASYPGVTGQAGQCANCHDPHGSANGTSKVSMKTLRGVYNDGKTSYTAGDFALCFACHNNTSANSKYDIQSQYNDIEGGHYIKTAGGNLAVGSKLPCEDCHSLHGSANNNKYALNDNLGSNLGDGRNECLACHQTGKVVEGITMSAPPSSVPEHAAGNTTACLNCHGSAHAPTPGVSKGGVDCNTCHSPLAVALSSTTSGYHHLITDTSATYGTTQNGSKNCLTCHVDHNKFNNQKAYNLKANYSENFPTSDTTPGQNTDFNANDTVYGGLCLSCHQNQQIKGYTQPDGSTVTQPVSISGFANSAHNYTATSVFGDGTVFNANCVKCHNDNMDKSKQTSANKFGTHNSDFQDILSPFGDPTLTDPLQQQFCLKCHNSSGDYYGTTMSAAAKGVQTDFSQASTHDITGASGAQLTCVNCHGPHTVSKDPFSAGKAVSDISDPNNTLNPYTTSTGDFSKFCISCHDGTPPVAVNNGLTLVPYSVAFPNTKFTSNTSGWDKTAYTGSGHYAQGYQCDKCHDSHGSPYPRLTLLPEDTSAAPSSSSGICLQCHGNQSGRPAGAADVYTDLTTGPDSTYRHPTLYATGKHTDTETFPQTTAQRHADCNDCHDPHSANGSAASGGKASGKIAGVTGVTPTYPTANSVFAAPQSYTLGTADKEYQLCFKCHTGYNGNFPAPPTGAIAETDLAREFNPANPSFHDVGLYTGTARSYVGAFQTGTNMTGSTVLYCTSCHGANTSAATLTATSSPVHGSSNRYILKGAWNSTLTLGSSTASNNLCLKCHNVKSGSSRFTDGTRNLHALGDHGNISCQSCHSEVPHGGVRPSLITIMPASSYTGVYKYDASYDGVYGKNSKLYLKNWKSGGTRWSKSDCGCNGPTHD